MTQEKLLIVKIVNHFHTVRKAFPFCIYAHYYIKYDT